LALFFEALLSRYLVCVPCDMSSWLSSMLGGEALEQRQGVYQENAPQVEVYFYKVLLHDPCSLSLGTTFNSKFEVLKMVELSV